MDNNQRLKALQIAMRLNAADIAHACQSGGYQASISDARHWTRGAGKAFDKGPSYTPKGYTDYKPIPDDAFSAFCLGVKAILDQAEQAE